MSRGLTEGELRTALIKQELTTTEIEALIHRAKMNGAYRQYGVTVAYHRGKWYLALEVPDKQEGETSS